jgi:2-polyprenyl-3-methyl-5-hydroxy-6-metoxy-1,4-benzoquinol methylase
MEWFIQICERFKRRFVPIHYDATFHPAEIYYTSIYMDRMRPLLDFLDAGCGTGRFLVPFAEQGHRMTAIDFHHDSLRIAVENANKAGVEVASHAGDLQKVIQQFDDHSFDAVMSIEVLYTSKNREGVMAELQRVLRPGGLLFVTHRTRFYYLTQALAKGAIDDANLIATKSEGRLLKKLHRIHYNWQSKAEIEAIYHGLGMEIQQMSGIGPYTGCESDPKASICNPADLTPPQQTALRAVEDAADPETMMASRYVLVAARKPSETGS